ncbi:MAG: MotA/TolQ/ExbB proton channel family protein [Verrucomicrobiota bacterium]
MTLPSIIANASLWQMISQGGWAMIPLGISSLVLIYLILHCFRETAPKNFGHDALASDIASALETGPLNDAIAIAKREGSLLSRSIAEAFGTHRTTEQMESKIIETVDLEEHAISQWIQYLAVVATAAPMVGLLGTVSGMIGAFQTMSSGGMGRPELLAGDIGEALITTATGLCIGIPAMVFHSFFTHRLENQLVETTQRASQILEQMETSSTAESGVEG